MISNMMTMMNVVDYDDNNGVGEYLDEYGDDDCDDDDDAYVVYDDSDDGVDDDDAGGDIVGD